MAKIICCADIHIQDGLFLQVGIDFLDYISEYAKENDINKIAFLGDLFDKDNRIRNNVFIPTFKKIEEMKESGLEMWFIVGNHEETSTITSYGILEVFEKFGHLVNSCQTYEFGETVINMCPFTKDEQNVMTVNGDYLFTHLNITGFKMSGGKISGEEQQAFPVSMFSNYKKVFTGHYHKRQQIENIEYIGSPYQLDFGECGDFNKGFIVFDTETGNEEFIKYENAPHFKKIRYDDIIEEIKNGTVDDESLRNSLLQITIDRKVDELSKLKSILYNNFGVIEIVNEYENKKENNDIEDVEIEMNVSISEMLEDFILSSNENIDGFEITGEELREAFLEIRGDRK